MLHCGSGVLPLSLDVRMLKLLSEMVGNDPRTHPALQFKRLQPCEDAFSITTHKNNSQQSASSSSGMAVV